MSTNPFRSVTPSEALALSEDPQVRFVDVRTVAEFERGHVDGSYNVPILFHGPAAYGANPDFVDVIKRHFPLGADLVFVWRAGIRSQRACELLAAEGFGSLINMVGGTDGGPDASGMRFEPGWISCEQALTTQAHPDRTWSALQTESA